MLGLLITALSVTVIVLLTVFRRDLPLLILIAIFTLTAELGEGFTSFNGSIFFNQRFLHFANLKLVEVILYTYTGAMILLDIPVRRKHAPSKLRRLFLLWIVWLAVLLYVQYDAHGSIDPFLFRGIYFGWALLYVFTTVIDNRPVMKRVVNFTFILIIAKAIWLMVMFAVGRGDYTSRGYSPLFWDDKLLEGFTWAFLVLLVALLQTRGEKGDWPTTWVSIGLALIFVVIALSLRRSNLIQLFIGAMFVFFNRNHQIQLRRFISASFIGVFLLLVLLTVSLVFGNRLSLARQLTKYVDLLHYTSVTDFASQPENEVHLFNVQTYITILSEYEGIRSFGRSAAPTDNFDAFNREYLSSLGLAHNGPLRAIFDFGIGGLIVWLGFFFLTFRAYYRSKFKRLELWEQALFLGSTVTIFSHLVITLTFIPPFFTTTKGFFFFLFPVCIIEFFSRETLLPKSKTADSTPMNQHVNNHTPVRV